MEQKYNVYVIKRCMAKGAIERVEPGFVCHALVSKKSVQMAETDELIEKMYDGAADSLFAALLHRERMSAEQIARLKKMIEELE